MIKFNKKKLTKKVRAVIKSDVMGSIALVSVLINIFFFSGVVLFSATNQLDVSLYNTVAKNLCVDHYQENLLDQMTTADNPATAKANFEIKCGTGEFERYYNNAVEAYLNDTL